MPLSGRVRTSAHDFTRRLFIGLTFGTGVTNWIARHRGCISRPSETRKKDKNARDGDDIGFDVFQGSRNLLSLAQTSLQLYRFYGTIETSAVILGLNIIMAVLSAVSVLAIPASHPAILWSDAFFGSRVSKVSDKKSANLHYKESSLFRRNLLYYSVYPFFDIGYLNYTC